MNTYLAVTRTEINGKIYLREFNKLICASCLYQQPTVERTAKRDKDGIVEGWYLEIEDEQHSKNCKQTT